MPEIIAENISIINNNELEGTTRIDAEYYQPRYLNERTKLYRFKNTFKIKQLASIITNGHTPYHHDLIKGPIKFLTAENIYDFYIDYENSKRIYEESHLSELSRTALYENDLLITIKGKIGNAAVVYNLKEETNINQDVARIVFKKHINPFYVSAFINSDLGKLQVEQISTGQINPFLALGNLKELQIPFFNRNFESEIEHLLKGSLNLFEQSQLFYSQAENLLLEELGIKNINLFSEPCYEVNSANTITANRIDAEYYQPKYEKIIKEIKNCKYGWCKLSDKIINVKEKYNLEKEYEKEFKYIELSNINASIGVIDDFTTLKGKDLPSRARMLVKENDVIISSVEGSIDKVALVDKHYNECLASTGFFVFRNKENILPEYILSLCKSVLIQKQLEKLSSGTILTAVPKNLVQNIIIPNTPKKAQIEIVNLVHQSHSAHHQAKQLLAEAKRKVEEMIEKG